MLILARKIGESLIIGDNIEVKIVEVSGNQVKIGIDAPKECKIIRKELSLTKESNLEAANASSSKKDLLSFLSQYKKL